MMNNNVMNQIISNAASAINELHQGKPAVEIAAAMYTSRLPGKSERTAAMMAQQVADTVAEYYSSVAAATEDYTAWVNSACEAATADMNATAAYNRLYQLYIGAVAAGRINHASTEEEKAAARAKLEEDAAKTFTDSEVTPEALEELKGKLASALQDIGLVTTQLEAMQEMLRNEDADANMVVDFGSMTQDVMIVLSMQAYLDAKNGLYPDIPSNTQLEDITRNVCASMDTFRIAAQVANGEITEEEAFSILGAIGSIIGFFTGLVIVVAGVSAVVGAVEFLTFPLLGILAGTIAGVAMFEPVTDGMMNAGRDVGNLVQHIVVASVKLVVKGIKLIVGAVVKGAKALWARIQARTQNSAETAAETATETADLEPAAPVIEAEAVLA